MLKSIQFIAGGLALLILTEGALTFGSCFDFSLYSAFAWVAQAILVAFTVTTALRCANGEIE